jgi:hypothetical protein
MIIFGLNGFPYLTAEFISFSQLIIEMLLLPTVIIGFIITVVEFRKTQIKPDLNLIAGVKLPNQPKVASLTNITDPLIGQDTINDQPVSQVIIGLFLENSQPKAAQFVRVTLRVSDVPRPERFFAIEDSFQYYKPMVNTITQEALLLQFDEDVVVYQKEGVYLGNICVAWTQGTRPDRITLKAGLYSLESEPKEVSVSHPIVWT